MPYTFVGTHLNTSLSEPPLHIFASCSSRTPLAPVILLLPPRSYKSRCTPLKRFAPRFTSPLDKPLKSCLKCSQGRKASESVPTTPNVRKNTLPSNDRKSVHFKESDSELVSVCVFRATGRPSTILSPHSDTESEIEPDEASFLQRIPVAAPARTALLKVTNISPIPSPHTPPCFNVHLESISLLPARPPLLRGTVRVRNIAYEKDVTARFTLDGWTTVSEAHAWYTGSAASDDGTWDRFAFTISLELHLRPGASERMLLLAVRFAVPGVGEWWDNNGGNDFRIGIAPASTLPGSACTLPLPMPNAGPTAMSVTNRLRVCVR
ncbi:putative phosphatase regulatory subunit-domain-containing protein [Russula compacta]|nr:putative phosphatase regulatory subunit-domain-containing protein [Russula compacta]